MATRYNPAEILAPLLVGEECVSRIDAVLKRLAVLQSGMSPSRPDLLRAWIWDGLVEVEQKVVAMERQAAKTRTTFIPQYLPKSYPMALASAPPPAKRKLPLFPASAVRVDAPTLKRGKRR